MLSGFFGIFTLLFVIILNSRKFAHPDAFVNECKRNNLQLNIDKPQKFCTKVAKLYFLSGVTVESVDRFEDLGITKNSSLTFTLHTDKLGDNRIVDSIKRQTTDM